MDGQEVVDKAVRDLERLQTRIEGVRDAIGVTLMSLGHVDALLEDMEEDRQSEIAQAASTEIEMFITHVAKRYRLSREQALDVMDIARQLVESNGI